MEKKDDRKQFIILLIVAFGAITLISYSVTSPVEETGMASVFIRSDEGSTKIGRESYTAVDASDEPPQCVCNTKPRDQPIPNQDDCLGTIIPKCEDRPCTVLRETAKGWEEVEVGCIWKL